MESQVEMVEKKRRLWMTKRSHIELFDCCDWPVRLLTSLPPGIASFFQIRKPYIVAKVTLA